MGKATSASATATVIIMQNCLWHHYNRSESRWHLSSRKIPLTPKTLLRILRLFHTSSSDQINILKPTGQGSASLPTHKCPSLPFFLDSIFAYKKKVTCLLSLILMPPRILSCSNMRKLDTPPNDDTSSGECPPLANLTLVGFQNPWPGWNSTPIAMINLIAPSILKIILKFLLYRRKERSSIHWLPPQIPAADRTRPG